MEIVDEADQPPRGEVAGVRRTINVGLLDGEATRSPTEDGLPLALENEALTALGDVGIC